MLIYRIENNEGKGCYSRGFGHKCTAEAMETGDSGVCLHPGPNEEPKLKSWWEGEKLSRKKRIAWTNSSNSERHLWACGFESLEQLGRWFPADGLILMANMAERHQDSMAVVVYEVPHHKAKRGGSQVMYRRDHAVKVETIGLKEIAAQISA